MAAGAIAVALAVQSCGDDGKSCAILFGNPTADTGLDATQCRPQCSCNGNDFSPPAYDDAFIQSLVDDWVLSVPFTPLGADPYASPAPPEDPPGTVCAVLPGLRRPDQALVRRLLESGPPDEEVGVEPFAPPEYLGGYPGAPATAGTARRRSPLHGERPALPPAGVPRPRRPP